MSIFMEEVVGEKIANIPMNSVMGHFFCMLALGNFLVVGLYLVYPTLRSGLKILVNISTVRYKSARILIA